MSDRTEGGARILVPEWIRAYQKGVELWLVALTPGVLTMVQRSALGRKLQRDRLFFDLEHAVAHHHAPPLP